LTFQGIVSKFVFVPSKKISQVMPVYKYNSHVSTQSHDILANYMASSVQGYKCYGSLRPRGNTKKPKTPEDMVARSQLWDSDYSDDGSEITFSDRSLRCHKQKDPKQEKHQMASRQESGSAKRSKKELVDAEDFELNYDSPLEEFVEECDGKQYSSPGVLKIDSQIKDKGNIMSRKTLKRSHHWVLTLISSVKRLEQKVDNTSNEVELLKKDTAKEQEKETVVKSEKNGDEEDVEFVS